MDKYSIFWFYMRNEFFDSGTVTDDEAVEAGHRAVDLGINPRPGRFGFAAYHKYQFKKK